MKRAGSSMELPDQNLVAELCKALAGRKGLYKEAYHIVTADKSTPGKAYFAPLTNESRTVEGCTGIVEDVTEQHHLQEIDVIAHHGVLEEGVVFIQWPFSVQDLAVKT